MAERLLLEGVDLPELMEYVRAEYGPHARIVRAEKIRQGGFAGFFAKEKYELTIDVPAMPPVKPLRSHRPAAASTGMDTLLDAADAADGIVGATAQITADPQSAAQAATPRAATGGTQFSSVLDQVRALAADEPAPVVAPQVVEGEPPAVAPTGPAASGVPGAPPVGPTPGAVPVIGPALREALTSIGVPPQILAADPLTISGVIDQIPVPPPAPRRPGEILAVVGSMSDLATLEPLLVDRMRLSPTEIVRVGSVLRFELVPSTQDRATRITSPQALASWRNRAPMARHPWLVLVPIEGDAESRMEAAEFVAAAKPTQFWAVVDARTKAPDAKRWLDQIGRRREVDAVVVRALMDTAAPGTVLALGKPVAWLDGMPASRMVWAAALGQPIDAAYAQP